ncbi:MAG TPA: hypothetical protein VGH28_05245 [Polyangiaceae bacterium]
MRRLVTLALPLALVAIAPAVRAQSSADVDTARAAFLKGLDLRKHHDLPAAAERFRAAYALVPTPRIGYELGSTLRETGDLVAARAAFVAATELPPRPNESPEAKKARTDAQAQADDLDQRIPQIQLHIVGTGQIYVDGEPVRHEALSSPHKLNPGSHTIQIQVDGDVKGEKTISLSEGEHKDVTMSPGVEARVTVTANPVMPQVIVQPQPTAPYDPFATPVTNRVHSNAGTKAALFYAASTIAGVGIGPGVTALTFMKAAQDACTNGCDSSFENNKNLAYGFAIATDVLWGTALILLIAAIVYPSTSALEPGQVAGLQNVTFAVSPTSGGGTIGATVRF